MVRIAATLGVVALAFGGGGVVSRTVTALDESVFLGSSGTFKDPLRLQSDGSYSPNGIYCLQYGSGSPATFSPAPPNPVIVSDADPAPDPALGQDATLSASNQVRFGRIPAGLPELDLNGDGCSDDPGRETGFGSSGFGFDGAASRQLIGDGFLLAEVTHFNRTIQRGMHRVTVATSFAFDGPGGDVVLTTDLQIDLVETSDYTGVNDVTYCYDPPAASAGGSLGFDVSENFGGTFPGIGEFTSCADRVTITPVGALTPTYGETELHVDVIGFARLDGNGTCNPNDIVDGNSFFSRESQPTTLCLLAQLSGSTLTINKTVEGVGGDTFDFLLTEYDQRTSPVTAMARQSISVDAQTGSGTSGSVTIDPGLYLLGELDPGPGYTTSDPTCTSNGADATVEIAGVRYLDVDSNKDIICEFVNVVATTTTSPPTTSPAASTTTAGASTTAPATSTTTAGASTTTPATSTTPNRPSPSPTPPTATETPTGILPVTGSDSGSGLTVVALGVLIAGAMLAVVARRRPSSFH